MRSSIAAILASMLTVATACGGGGSTGGVVVPEPVPVDAEFVAAQPSPDAHTVSMSAGGSTEDVVVVRVDVTGQEGVWGAAFDVHFEGGYVEYEGFSAGNLLEQSGQAVSYTVQEPVGSSGLLVVGVSLTGTAPAIDVTTTRTLVNLTFRVTSVGSFPLSFGPGAALLDSNLDPLAGLADPWPGGDLIGN